MGSTKKKAAKKGGKRIVKKAKKKADPMGAIEEKVERVLKQGPKSNKELKEKVKVEDKALTRTLQRLRRRGKLKVIKGRWALSGVKVCPKCSGKGWVEE